MHSRSYQNLKEKASEAGDVDYLCSEKRSIDKSKRLYHKSLKHTEDIEQREHYLAYKNTLKKALQSAKRMFYQNKCIEFQQNTKKLWQIINKVSGKSNEKTTSIDCLSVDGVKQYSGETIVNTMAKYFANVGKTFANKIPNSSRSVAKVFRNSTVQ